MSKPTLLAIYARVSTSEQNPEAQLLSEGKAVRDIARTFNVHEATIYRLANAS